MIGIKQNTSDMGNGGGVSETQATWGRGRVTATQVTWGSKTVYNKKSTKKTFGSDNLNRFPGPTL